MIAVVTSDKEVIVGWENTIQATMWLDEWLAEKRDRWGFLAQTTEQLTTHPRRPGRDG